MTPEERAKLERWKSELAEAFADRRCSVPGCNAEVVAVHLARDEIRENGVLLKPAVPERNLCSDHWVDFMAKEGAI